MLCDRNFFGVIKGANSPETMMNPRTTLNTPESCCRLLYTIICARNALSYEKNQRTTGDVEQSVDKQHQKGSKRTGVLKILNITRKSLSGAYDGIGMNASAEPRFVSKKSTWRNTYDSFGIQDRVDQSCDRERHKQYGPNVWVSEDQRRR
jgi:hypothetical protein